MIRGAFLFFFLVKYTVQCETILKIGRCIKEDAFDVFSEISSEECVSRCLERSLCLSVSYHRVTQVCFLRQKRFDDEQDITAPKRCFNLNIDHNIDESDNSSLKNQTTNSNSSYYQTQCDELSISSDNDSGNITCATIYCNATTHTANSHFVTRSVTGVGRPNLLQCQKGYTAFGQASVTCLPSGNFTETDFRCAQNCPDPPVKTGATLYSWYPYRFTKNTTAIYVCNEGFYTFSVATIVCGADGKWTPFECTPACHHSTAPNVANSYVLPGTWYTVKDLAKYACHDGYYLSPGNPFISCDVNGNWGFPKISCYRYCTQETIYVPNGQPKPGDLYNYTMQAEFYCLSGYYLSPGTPTISCDENGFWWTPAVQCYRYCTQETIPVLPNGYPKQGDLYNYTMQAEYSCSSGYYLSPGWPFIMCSPNGDWSIPHVTCYPYCSVPKPGNGEALVTESVQYTFGEKAEYSCNDGYYMSTLLTTSTVTCNVTGTWIYNTECYKHCGFPPSGDNAALSHHVPPYTYQSIATYECNPDHFFETSKEKHCNTNGEWTGFVLCCPLCHDNEDGECVLNVLDSNCANDFWGTRK